MSRKSLEEQYWAIRAENACRIGKAAIKRLESLPVPLKLKRGQNKTRSSFAHAQRNRIVDKLVPVDFNSSEINYLPMGVPSLYDRQPILSFKNITEYIVVQRQGRRECLFARGFTKCCPPERFCQTTRCAKCWVLKQKQVKGVEYIVREVYSGKTPKVVDPNGVDPKGRRAQGKDLDLETRSRFRLTSSQGAYKHGASAWNEPD